MKVFILKSESEKWLQVGRVVEDWKAQDVNLKMAGVLDGAEFWNWVTQVL